MRRPILLAALLGLSMLPAQAAFYLSPDVPTDLGGATYLPSDIVIKSDAGTYGLALSLPAGTPVDGLYRLASGSWLLSFDSPTVLAGTTYDPRDVIRFDGVGNFALFFSGVAAGIPAESNVDAIFLDGGDTGDLILSFDVPTTIGATTYEPADLVRVSGGVFSLFFDASATTPAIPISSNLTGGGRRGNRTFLTFDVPTTLGAATYLPGQIVTWDGTGFAPFSVDTAWPIGSRVNALALGSCLDGDGDGYGLPGDASCPAGVSSDCDDTAAAGTIWGTPGEVQGLQVGNSGMLSWLAPATLGGIPASVLYDTIRSTIRNDFVGTPQATCIESNDGPNTTASDPATPPLGMVFYYLIRARNGCPGTLGVGSLGTTSGGGPRSARDCP